jgi:hypothetical protein
MKHTLATRGSPGRAIRAVEVGAGAVRAPPPPPLVAPGLARPGGQRAMGGCEWRGDDGRAAATRRSESAASGREGRGWRRPVARGRRGGCVCVGRMYAAVGKKCSHVFYFLEKNHIVERWSDGGPGTNGTRLDGCRVQPLQYNVARAITGHSARFQSLSFFDGQTGPCATSSRPSAAIKRGYVEIPRGAARYARHVYRHFARTRDFLLPYRSALHV